MSPWMISLLVFAAGENVDGEPLLVLPPPPQFGQAPGVPDLVDDLDQPFPHVELGVHAVCYPTRTFAAIDQWIDYMGAYPTELCQPAIDTMTIAAKIFADEKVATETAKYRAEIATLEAHAATAIEPWVAWLIAAGLVGVGGLGGFLVCQYVVH